MESQSKPSALGLIKKLREETGAGILECKQALEEGGNIEEAKKYLRKKGLDKVKKFFHKSTNEGAVAIYIDDNGTLGSILTLHSETDFVARNELFLNVAFNFAKLACKYKITDVNKFMLQEYSPGAFVHDKLTDLISSIKENIKVDRIGILEVNKGAIGYYIHNSYGNNVGRIGVMIALETQDSVDQDVLKKLGKEICMHIAFTRPDAAYIDRIDKKQLEEQKGLIEQEINVLNKPKNIADKMIEGKLNKYYQEVVLFEQIFIKDDSKKTKISDLIKEKELELKTEINIKDFLMFIA